MAEQNDFNEYKLLIMNRLDSIDNKLTCMDAKIDGKFDKYETRVAELEKAMAVIKNQAAMIGIGIGIVVSTVVNIIIKYI